MAKFNSFEDITAWKKAFEVTMDIYRISADGMFSKDFGLKDQIRRASVSIMANIAEGHGRRTNLEFANFLNVARGSVAEVQSHLHVAAGLGYINELDFRRNYEILTEVSKMSLALAKYLRENDTARPR